MAMLALKLPYAADPTQQPVGELTGPWENEIYGLFIHNR